MNSLHFILTSCDRFFQPETHHIGHESTQNTRSIMSPCQSPSTQPISAPNPPCDKFSCSNDSCSDDSHTPPPSPRSSSPSSPHTPSSSRPPDDWPSHDLTHTQPSDTPCTSATCGVPGVPHTQGAYQHRGPFRDRVRRYRPWGWSDPPPAVWAALRRVTRAGLPEHWKTFAAGREFECWALRRDCELVAGFMAHHSCMWHPPDGFLEWAEMRRGEGGVEGGVEGREGR